MWPSQMVVNKEQYFVNPGMLGDNGETALRQLDQGPMVRW